MGLISLPPGTTVRGNSDNALERNTMTETTLYEVFVRAHHAAGHQHVGSLRAAGDAEALLHARDLYTRRGEGESLWVVRADAIVASEPAERAALFQPAASKTYRRPTAFPLHRGVKNM